MRSSTSACRPLNSSSLRLTCECSVLTLAAVSASSQKPGACICPSSAPRRSLSAAGSKVVREQLELVADRRQALGRRLGVGGRLGHRRSEGIFPATVNPLTLPPRLILRALDDLHAIAEAARRLPTLEAMLVDRFDTLDARAEEVLERMGEMLALGERVSERGREIVAFGERIDARGEELLERGGELVVQGREIVAQAQEVAVTGRELAAAFPTLERTAQIGETLAQAVEPLQGAAERLGRVVDRLPGGGRPRARGE